MRTTTETQFTFEPVVSSTDFSVSGHAGNEVTLISPGADFVASSTGATSSVTYGDLASMITAINGSWSLSFTESNGSSTRDYTLQVSASALMANDLRQITIASPAVQSAAAPAFEWTVASSSRPVLSGELATVSLVRPGPGVVGSVLFPQTSWSPAPVTAGRYEFAVSYQAPLNLLSVGSPMPVAGSPPIGSFSASASIVDAATSTVTLTAVPGDYNADGVANAADYTAWRDRLGGNGPLPNEAASPGTVDQADYAVWVANYGQPSPSSFALATPEPTGFGMLAVSAALARSIPTRRRASRRSVRSLNEQLVSLSSAALPARRQQPRFADNTQPAS